MFFRSTSNNFIPECDLYVALGVAKAIENELEGNVFDSLNKSVFVDIQYYWVSVLSTKLSIISYNIKISVGFNVGLSKKRAK